MPARFDPQQKMVYTLDHIFWGGAMPGTAPFRELITFEEWSEYAELLFADGLANP